MHQASLAPAMGCFWKLLHLIPRTLEQMSQESRGYLKQEKETGDTATTTQDSKPSAEYHGPPLVGLR